MGDIYTIFFLFNHALRHYLNKNDYMPLWFAQILEDESYLIAGEVALGGAVAGTHECIPQFLIGA